MSDNDKDTVVAAAAAADDLTLYKLPGDIYDAIAAFLPNPDLFHFLVLSRHLSVAPYLLRRRQHQKWARFYLWQLARIGDLQGVQYLHRLGVPFNTEAMDHAACNGHLAVVEFLHGVGAPWTCRAMNYATRFGHLAVVQFLHRVVGVPCTADTMCYAATNGHVAVVQFLHGIGAPYTANTISCAVNNGHLAVVGFLEKNQAKNI